MSEQKESFDQFAILQLFGHQRIAGRVTEANIGGSSFVRVDALTAEGEVAFTRYYGSGAIYSISPVSKEVCIAAAAKIDSPPVQPWEMKQAKLIPSSVSGDRDYDEEEEIYEPIKKMKAQHTATKNR